MPVPNPALCLEREIEWLVAAFYARVREDALIGPVFEAHVDEWPGHLSRLVDFWSAMLRGTRRFNGAPVQRHNALPDLNVAMFERWLVLFKQTTAELGNADMQQLADAMAERMAGTLMARYRQAHALRGD